MDNSANFYSIAVSQFLKQYSALYAEWSTKQDSSVSLPLSPFQFLRIDLLQ